ncbi:phosphoserine phosphatase SerB [Aquitalea aquatica]|uniref:Phosphoserine phosphatase n=1 Tax=Aquitalea aquatica TaxID=3044273 RepID=A0A838XXU6_9NEIS|nr:phosphoserine phosphatase SerB [Aquitalea magnusonii]MBA4707216.1 phosphoserine phosphatase SerB [Aquitalea magnusonii]
MPLTLVIQSPRLDSKELQELAALAGASSINQSSLESARLEQADPASRDAISACCQALGYDFAFVDSSLQLANFGLLVSDMDSTLITIECIDEIADMQGIKPQVAAITERSMRGELDFSASLRERVSLLAGLPESALEKVYKERLQLSPGAEQLLAACKQHGIRFMLVSGGFTFFTEKLKQELGLDYAYANQLEVVDGKLTGRVVGDIVDAAAKQRLLIEKREQLGLRPDQVIAMGDGANDLLMLGEAGVGIAYRAKPVVQAQTDVAINVMGLDGVSRLFA